MAILFKNNASTKLASGITAAATSMTVRAETGNLFPAPGANEYFLCTLVDDLGNKEIVKVTSRNADVFTIVRAQEGTTARAFNANSLVENRLTAGALNEVLNVTYASDAEVAAGVKTTKAISPATVSSANVASAVTAGTCTGNAATASDMAAGHILAGATTAAGVLSKIAPAVTTPAQFDNTTNIATTAFVRTAAGNLAGFSHVTTSTALTNAHVGTAVNVNNAGVTVTLPDPQAVPAGSSIVIRAGYDSTIVPPANSYIYAGDGSPKSTFSLGAYKTCTFFAAGNAWWAYSGTALSGGAMGAAMITTVGTTQFTVPAPNLRVTVCGGGAGGCSVTPNNAKSGNPGGTSSFGSHCSATGGTASYGTKGANGGTTGLIRLFANYSLEPYSPADPRTSYGRDGAFGVGGTNRQGSTGTAGHGAGYGSGGGGAEYNTGGGGMAGGGGAGGAGFAYITGLTVGSTINVTVGAGGTGGNSNNQAIGGNGAQGFVLVEW